VRPQLPLRARGPWTALGALAVTYTATASASLALGSDSPAPLNANVAADHLGYDEPVVVTGQVPDGQAGHPVALEFAPAGGPWSPIQQAQTAAGGSYRLSAPVTRSGSLRISAGAPSPHATAASVGVGTSLRSPEHPIVVGASITTTQRQLDVLAGRWATVSGTIAPAAGGRPIALEVQRHGQWRAVAHAHTATTGGYRLTYRPASTGSTRVRVTFPGDTANGPSQRGLGRVNSYHVAQASFYGPGMYGSSLACGGRLGPGTMGVANKTLPCGTMVTLRYRGRRVRVPVVDRGPYVSGREYDLTAATKQALRFPSTGSLWATR